MARHARRVRILHVLDHALPLQSGYTFRTRAIMKAQLGRGWQVAGVSGQRQRTPAAGWEEADGLRFFRTPNGGGEAAGLVRFARAIDRAVRAFRPDLVHAHSPALDALAAWPVARLHRLPLVYEIRAFWEDAAVGKDRKSVV